MLNLIVEPLLNPQAGNVVITGTVSNQTADLYWGFDGETVTRTDGFSRNGQGFELSVIVASTASFVEIKAVDGAEESGVVTVNLQTGGLVALEPSFQFNEFDELGQTVGLERFPSESNESYRDRCMDAKAYPGNASTYNRLRALDRDLGLPPLDPFFQLRLRWDPRTQEPYTRAWIEVKSNSCIYQELSFYVVDEPIFPNALTGEVVLSKTLGQELEDDLRLVVKSSSGEELSKSTYKIQDDTTLIIDWDLAEIDPDKILLISYPYQEEYVFSGFDPLIKANFSNTVTDFKTWLLGLSTVVDEDSNVVSPLVWMDGYFEEVNSLPDGASTSPVSAVELLWNSPSAGYFEITENTETEYHLFTETFPNKGLFAANQVVPFGSIELSHEPTPFTGSWSRIDSLTDDDFVSKITTTHEAADKNLKYYADLTREVTRMGIDNTLVDRDYWSNDHPDRIGERFLPSIYDVFPDKFTILTDSGIVDTISLKRRKFLARRRAGEKIF